MKRGFTLIELLGVIILLSIIITLTFPTIINFIKSSGDETDELAMKLIYNAAEQHVKSNKNEFSKVNGNSYCIDLKELVELGYLYSPIKLSNEEDITNIKTVQVTYQNKFDYKLVDKENCIETNEEITE